MPKWADYVITAVRYDHHARSGEGSRVAAVEVHMDLGGRLGYAEIWTRQQVLEAVHQDHETFVTAFQGVDGAWMRGAHLQVMRICGLDYLRVDRSEVSADNLGRTAPF
jgi:hypothetical protein